MGSEDKNTSDLDNFLDSLTPEQIRYMHFFIHSRGLEKQLPQMRILFTDGINTYSIDLASGRFFLGEEQLQPHLSSKQLEVFTVLLDNENTPITAPQLVELGWPDQIVDKQYLDMSGKSLLRVTIGNIRKTLGKIVPELPKRLQTIEGFGYMWGDPPKLEKNNSPISSI